METTLNISELLKRAGVVGDSRGSGTLLDQLRMSVKIADLSQLVPPLRGPIAGGSLDVIPGLNKFGNWTLHCRSAGGLQVMGAVLEGTLGNIFGVKHFITTSNPWAAPVAVPVQQYTFGQVAESVFSTGTPVASLAPAEAVFTSILTTPIITKNIWLGPGLFLNFELVNVNTPLELSIAWMEYPGALNP